jgi:aspartyl-tRNA(Asn)/glutamyl-tRNA(Gln) amidotransferase subunit C
MPIEKSEVSRVANLAKLSLSPEEIELYQSQLGRILEAVSELSAVDTAGVAPTLSVLGLKNVMGKDEPRAAADSEPLLSIAPEREGPYYKVGKVIE